jgi:hypothetical protein
MIKKMSWLSRVAFVLLLSTILFGSISCSAHPEENKSSESKVEPAQNQGHKKMAILYLMEANESIRYARESDTIVASENFYLQEAQVFAAEAQVHATLYLAEVTSIKMGKK